MPQIPCSPSVHGKGPPYLTSLLKYIHLLSGPVDEWSRHLTTIPVFLVWLPVGALVGLAARAVHVSTVTFISACLSSLVPSLSPLSGLSTRKTRGPKTNHKNKKNSCVKMGRVNLIGLWYIRQARRSLSLVHCTRHLGDGPPKIECKNYPQLILGLRQTNVHAGSIKKN